MAQLLRNLGPKSTAWLKAVGFQSAAQIEAVGPVVCYLQVKKQFPQATLHLLYAIAAGLLNLDWRELPPPMKKILQKQLQSQVTQ